MAGQPVPRNSGGAENRSSTATRIVSKREAVAAAKAKVTVDRKLGRETPAWVKELAKGG